MRRFLWLAFIFVLLTACTPTTETAVSPPSSPETAVLPTVTVPPPIIIEEVAQVEAATAVSELTQPPADPTPTEFAAEPEPVVAEVVAASGVISGRTDEGAYFLGDPNAPITHIDYSDFL